MSALQVSKPVNLAREPWGPGLKNLTGPSCCPSRNYMEMQRFLSTQNTWTRDVKRPSRVAGVKAR